MTAPSKQFHVQQLAGKYEALQDAGAFTERSRRLWAAAEATALGYGGISLVRTATGLDHKTIRAGIAELTQPKNMVSGRIRRLGGGRLSSTAKDPKLWEDLEYLVDPVTRGDPQSPLRWTSKSCENLASALRAQRHAVSADTVGRLLKRSGYALQANRKTREGSDHPDRDQQFRFIAKTVKDFQRRQQPIISVDTKKKELVGSFKQTGQEWSKTKQPVTVNMHDFPEKTFGKVIPYGIYDLQRNEGWMNVGITHDTAEFAVRSIRTWWQALGQSKYPRARELLITADCGGSNGRRVRLWKQQLQHLADEIGLTIHVRHFPPGTSKWNKIEHRLFSFVTKNWRGRPLIDRATVINLIGNTRTASGLKVYATLDYRMYPTGIHISPEDMRQLNLRLEDWHGEWNYRLEPRRRQRTR